MSNGAKGEQFVCVCERRVFFKGGVWMLDTHVNPPVCLCVGL